MRVVVKLIEQTAQVRCLCRRLSAQLARSASTATATAVVETAVPNAAALNALHVHGCYQ
jgi:hypothetical protein